MACYIGLMSGTSLDGVDAVAISFDKPPTDPGGLPDMFGMVHVAWPPEFTERLLALQTPSHNDLHESMLVANEIARYYAECVSVLLKKIGLTASDITALGAHGQTVRHRPELGYTVQLLNGALLSELTGIDTVCDMRASDVAAGGNGAPLVIAFHQGVFAEPGITRVIANIGGIANITVLSKDGSVTGCDTGPGNMAIDALCRQHLGKPYDEDGAWAASGTPDDVLLGHLMNLPFFREPPPKSTGRELFGDSWLENALKKTDHPVSPQDVCATLTLATAKSIADMTAKLAPDTMLVAACGGGAYNKTLLSFLDRELKDLGVHADVCTTNRLGVDVMAVEAAAFAWLAHRHVTRLSGNVPQATGAAGYRIPGAFYPKQRF